MNTYKLATAGINVYEGIERFNGNRDMYEKYLKKFPDDANFNTLCDSLEFNNIDSAFKAAHALKGISGNLSLTKLYKDLQPLVEELRVGSIEKANQFFDQIKQDYDMVTKAIKED